MPRFGTSESFGNGDCALAIGVADHGSGVTDRTGLPPSCGVSIDRFAFDLPPAGSQDIELAGGQSAGIGAFAQPASC